MRRSRRTVAAVLTVVALAAVGVACQKRHNPQGRDAGSTQAASSQPSNRASEGAPPGQQARAGASGGQHAQGSQRPYVYGPHQPSSGQPAGGAGGVRGGRAQVDQFHAWVARPTSARQGTPAQASKGLHLLEAALSGLVHQGFVYQSDSGHGVPRPDVGFYRQQLTAIAHYAGLVGRTQPTGGQTRDFRDGALAAANLLESMQHSRFRSMQPDVQRVREAAEQLDVGQPLDNQTQRVGQFFGQTDRVVQAMAHRLWPAATGGGPAGDAHSGPEHEEPTR